LSADSLIKTQNQFNAATARTVIETIPRYNTSPTGISLTSGQTHVTFFTPIKTTTINAISTVTVTGASGTTFIKYGLYTYPEEDGNAVLVAQTANSPSSFQFGDSQNVLYLSTAGGYPSTYTLVAGTRYGLAILWIGTVAPTLAGYTYSTETVGAYISPYLSRARNNQSDLTTTLRTNAGIKTMAWARLETL
jgi:hypothetical protein